MEDKELIDALRVAVKENTAPGPELRAALARIDDPAVLRRAGKALSGLSTDDDGLRPVRVAVLATCTIGPYEQLLQAELVAAGMLPRVEPGRYGMFEMSLGTAEFAQEGDPDVVSCLLDESYFLPDEWDPADVTGLGEHVSARLDDLRGLLDAAK